MADQNITCTDCSRQFTFTDSELRRSGRMTAAQKRERARREAALGRPDPRSIEREVAALTTAHGCGVLAAPGDAADLAAQIQDYYGDGKALGMSIEYVIEEAPLGTAGSVKNAEALLVDHEPFLVISGDQALLETVAAATASVSGRLSCAATAAAARFYPQARTLIDLGGEDSKLIAPIINVKSSSASGSCAISKSPCNVRARFVKDDSTRRESTSRLAVGPPNTTIAAGLLGTSFHMRTLQLVIVEFVVEPV